MRNHEPRVVLLAGGVGGARMARGLAGALPEGCLSIIVNVGDDERFHGLAVSPDIDTVTYTLAGLVSPQHGWGVSEDTVHALGMLRKLGASDTWMHLGDADIGLHLYRSSCLGSGHSMTRITQSIAETLGVSAVVIPASDDLAPTLVETCHGLLRFQEWFVKHHAEPLVRRLEYQTANARISDAAEEVLRGADLIVIAPSNPLLSIFPMLALPGFKDAIDQSRATRIAVSPLIGGRAVKGPLDRLLRDLGVGSGNGAIAALYADLIDVLVIDYSDEADLETVFAASGVAIETGATRIGDKESAIALAQTLLRLHERLEHSAGRRERK